MKILKRLSPIVTLSPLKIANLLAPLRRRVALTCKSLFPSVCQIRNMARPPWYTTLRGRRARLGPRLLRAVRRRLAREARTLRSEEHRPSWLSDGFADSFTRSMIAHSLQNHPTALQDWRHRRAPQLHPATFGAIAEDIWHYLRALLNQFSEITLGLAHWSPAAVSLKVLLQRAMSIFRLWCTSTIPAQRSQLYSSLHQCLQALNRTWIL